MIRETELNLFVPSPELLVRLASGERPLGVRAGPPRIRVLRETYFDTPGFQVQFNVVDSDMLRDAQVNPENYRDLIVRVAGFSAFFVELSKSIQDQVIERTEHEL